MAVTGCFERFWMMRRLVLWLRVLGVLGLLGVAGCAKPGFRYKTLFLPLSQMGIPVTEVVRFPVFLVDEKTGEAVSGARFSPPTP